MKKLLNDVHALVPEALEGLAWADPGVGLLDGYTIAIRTGVEALRARGEVALISGGGAGHEPAHAGYVGAGLLTAAVAGDVFTSPSTDAVLAAIEAASGPGGVLLIVKNYTGDRLNFGLAAEIARSRGHAVEMVVVADDAALAADGDHAGRRGIAGTVLVHKVAGAAAAAGKSLAEVKAAALQAIASIASMGVGLTPCTVPAAGQPGFALGPDEIELGLGIHGEPGVARVPLASADAIVDRLLSTLVADLKLAPGARVALLVNNLGGTPVIELSLVMRSALSWLDAHGLRAERGWCGTFLTALEMAGVSLTLMRLDDALVAALDAPARASAWPAQSGRLASGPNRMAPAPAAGSDTGAPEASAAGPLLDPASTTARALRAVADTLEAAEAELTRLDQQVGDGDLGLSLSRGARALRAELSGYPGQSTAAVLVALSGTVRRALGGTSGALYAIGLLRAAAALEHSPQDGGAALRTAVDAIAQVGGAGPGDCTMLDALEPAAQAWSRAQAGGAPLSECLASAASAARAGATATASMQARRGRSSYLGERVLGHRDPGAQAVALWLQALADALRAES